MNIFIAGGGRIGFHLARLLSVENNDITVIEQNPNRLEQIDYALDVRTVAGNAASVMLLRETGVGSADLFVSVSGVDEVNLIAAATAKGLGAKQVVARVDQPVFIESSILYENIFGIDYLLSPEALTAHEIVKYIENPGIVATENFGRGRVQMRQMRVTKSPTTGGKTLKDVWPPGSGVLLGLISRDGAITIPSGDATVKPGDLITLIGEHQQMAEILKWFQGTELKPRRVFIMGGSSVGLLLAQGLENRQISVKLFDYDLSRCNEMAAKLKKAKVVCRDATTRVALEQEHVDEVDVFVAATDDDERNIMANVLAKELGATQSIAVVHQPDFAPLVARLGIDHAVTPRACFANRILRLVRRRQVASLAVLEEGQVEILEFNVRGESPILGKTLKEISSGWPQGALVATILRGDNVIVPSGDDEVLAGDSVIVIAASEALEAVQKLF